MTSQKKLILGVTGGIASGKSIVMKVLAKSRIPTVSADDLAHRCILRGKPAYQLILRRFGREILAPDRQIDRKKLGARVFANPLMRKQLEKMVHPCVAVEMKRFIQSHQGLMAIDIPLLFEAKFESWVDKILVVYCSREQQLKRLMRRNDLSRDAALQRLAAQISLRKKCLLADIVLKNISTVKRLENDTRKMLGELRTIRKRS